MTTWLHRSCSISAALITLGVSACAMDSVPGGDDDRDHDNTTNVDSPTGSAAVDETATTTSHEEGGRMYITRKDGRQIPLLAMDEMRFPTGTVVRSSDAPTIYTLPPPAWDLSGYQTPVKDQLDRGTCGSFATVGAIEAAYVRGYGLSLDLSEQYMFSIAKSTTLDYPRYYQYENQSSYWYGGGWPTTQYMLPTEAQAPYAGYNYCPSGHSCTPLSTIPGATSLVWTPDAATNHVTQQQVDDFEYSPLHIPLAARQDARYGATSVTSYGTGDSRNTTLLESLISSNHEVVISITTQWRTLPSGYLEYDPTVSGGGHVVLLIGYDRAAGYFLVKNSWGGAAPSAYLKLTYNFLQQNSWGASVINSVASPSAGAQAKAQWMGKWYSDHDGWTGTLVVRRITDVPNGSVRFGNYYLYGSYANARTVNGYSIDNNRGLRYYVASEVENAPGTLTGQQFDADRYDSDVGQAAGAVYWTGGEGGVHLTRTALYMPYSNTFSASEWLGTWDIDFNGYMGLLSIYGATLQPNGSYTLSTSPFTYGGTSHSVSGTLDPGGGIARLLIDGTTTYTLHYHGWDDRLSSGFITRSGVQRSGIHAVRR